jgi:hypothetical protein
MPILHSYIISLRFENLDIVVYNDSKYYPLVKLVFAIIELNYSKFYFQVENILIICFGSIFLSFFTIFYLFYCRTISSIKHYVIDIIIFVKRKLIFNSLEFKFTYLYFIILISVFI